MENLNYSAFDVHFHYWKYLNLTLYLIRNWSQEEEVVMAMTQLMNSWKLFHEKPWMWMQ
jgi:hypothetical protein